MKGDAVAAGNAARPPLRGLTTHPTEVTVVATIPPTVPLPFVLVSPDSHTPNWCLAGHCIVAIPPANLLPIGSAVFSQIVVQHGAFFASSRGTWFGIGN